MKRLTTTFSALLVALAALAADVQTQGPAVTIRPDGGQAQVIRLEVVNDRIIRVRATSQATLPVKPASLMVVPQQARVASPSTMPRVANSSRRHPRASSSGISPSPSASWA